MPTCFAVRFIVPSVRIRWSFNAVDLCEIPKVFSSHLVCFSVFLFWAVSFSLPLSFNSVRRVPGHVPCQLWMKSGPNRRTQLQSDSLYKAVKDASASCERRPETSTWSSMHIFTGWVDFTCPHFYCLIDECAFKYMNKKCKPFVWKCFELSIYVCI